MESAIGLVIVCLVLSSVGYLAYLLSQKNILHTSALVLFLAGFLFLSSILAISAYSLSAIPVRNLRETLIMVAWAVAGVYCFAYYRFRMRVLGAIAAPLCAIAMIITLYLPHAEGVHSDIYYSFWLAGHIVVTILGESFFALACGIGVLYLVQERAIKSKKQGFFFHRLPPLEFLDTAGYACITTGFVMLTIGLVTGLVYAKTIWGRFWGWDPKEVFSAVSWLIYAVLLHQRVSFGWRGRQAAIMAIIGFATILFTFFGVNLFLQGHHGEFTSGR